MTEQGWDILECSCLSRRLPSFYVNTNPFCMKVAILVLLKLSDWNRVRLRGGFSSQRVMMCYLLRRSFPGTGMEKNVRCWLRNSQAEEYESRQMTEEGRLEMETGMRILSGRTEQSRVPPRCASGWVAGVVCGFSARNVEKGRHFPLPIKESWPHKHGPSSLQLRRSRGGPTTTALSDLRSSS